MRTSWLNTCSQRQGDARLVRLLARLQGLPVPHVLFGDLGTHPGLQTQQLDRAENMNHDFTPGA